MEALYFPKFRRSTNTHEQRGQNCNPLGVTEDDECDQGDDSFFELEFTSPDFDTTNSVTKAAASNHGNSENDSPGGESHEADKRFDTKQEALENSAIKTDLPPQKLSESPTEAISKRKVLPIEPITKPQSAISLSRSAPKLPVLAFKNPKMASEKTKKQQSKLFSDKFKFEESPNLSAFTTSSTSQRQNFIREEKSLSDASSKSFSKEYLQRYLKLIKPLYIRVSKRNGEKTKSSGASSVTSSSSSSPATVCSPRTEKQSNMSSGFRTVSKHFGKSKSTSSPANRRDDSILLQNEGINGAIMHCKRSFNSSSSDSSMLSRLTIDPFPGSCSMD